MNPCVRGVFLLLQVSVPVGQPEQWHSGSASPRRPIHPCWTRAAAIEVVLIIHTTHWLTSQDGVSHGSDFIGAESDLAPKMTRNRGGIITVVQSYSMKAPNITALVDAA